MSKTSPGQRLKRLRKANNLTIREAAMKLNLSIGELSNIEHDRDRPTRMVLDHMASIYNLIDITYTPDQVRKLVEAALEFKKAITFTSANLGADNWYLKKLNLALEPFKPEVGE